jgi:hypothetical protein
LFFFLFFFSFFHFISCSAGVVFSSNIWI